MLTQKQKKMAVGVGLGATALGTALLVHHHKKEKKKSEHRSSKHHSKEKYYGNGVYCDDKECHVDWHEAWKSIGNIIGKGIAQAPQDVFGDKG